MTTRSCIKSAIVVCRVGCRTFLKLHTGINPSTRGTAQLGGGRYMRKLGILIYHRIRSLLLKTVQSGNISALLIVLYELITSQQYREGRNYKDIYTVGMNPMNEYEFNVFTYIPLLDDVYTHCTTSFYNLD